MNNTNKSFSFRGKNFFGFIVLLYLLVSLFNAEASLSALNTSMAVLKKVLPVFCLVILFTALLSWMIKPKLLTKHLGEESGAKGWLWALAAGIISHGPLYAWYPLIEQLRRRGVRDGILVTFFASRAIKVPLLPMMIDYFGLLFTLILSVNIIFGALMQGFIVELLSRSYPVHNSSRHPHAEKKKDI